LESATEISTEILESVLRKIYSSEIDKLKEDYSMKRTFYEISWTLSLTQISKDTGEEKPSFK